MRISELSAVSAVAIPTLKFYLRERLMPPGRARAANQADYDQGHLHRLRLIRALTEIGGLRLREVRAVVAAIDDERMPLHDLLGVAQYALERTDEDDRASSSESAADRGLVDDVVRRLGWTVNPDAPARRSLGRALGSLRQLGWNVSGEDVAIYGRAVDEVAAMEVRSLPANRPRGEVVERLVVGTVLFEAVLVALRRLAQEHHSSQRFGAQARTPDRSAGVSRSPGR